MFENTCTTFQKADCQEESLDGEAEDSEENFKDESVSSKKMSWIKDNSESRNLHVFNGTNFQFWLARIEALLKAKD